MEKILDNKNKFKMIGKFFYWVFVCILILIALLVGISAINMPGNLKLYSVKSGSMEPTIHTGSLVISKPSDNYQVGDIITFKSSKDKSIENQQNVTTHRIFKVITDNNNEIYITRGDANDAPDIEQTSKVLVQGKLILSIPLIGYVVSFAQSREGLLLLIIIPAIVIIFSELLNVRDEIKRIIEKRKKRNTSTEEIVTGK